MGAGLLESPSSRLLKTIRNEVKQVGALGGGQKGTQ